MITMVLNGNKKLNVWFWLIMSNIRCAFWLLVTCFDPPMYLGNFDSILAWILFVFYICKSFLVLSSTMWLIWSILKVLGFSWNRSPTSKCIKININNNTSLTFVGTRKYKGTWIHGCRNRVCRKWDRTIKNSLYLKF